MRRNKAIMLALCLLGGIAVGVSAEWLFTGVEIKASEIFSAVLLSPIILTVGGGHFPAIEGADHYVFVWQGILTVPAITVASVVAYRLNCAEAYLGLLLLVAWLYFGLLRRTLAIMPV